MRKLDVLLIVEVSLRETRAFAVYKFTDTNK